MLEITAVKNQDKKDILPVSPNLAPTITATKGGTINTKKEKNPFKVNPDIKTTSNVKAVPGVLIIGENRAETTKIISSSGIKAVKKTEMATKPAFNPM